MPKTMTHNKIVVLKSISADIGARLELNREMSALCQKRTFASSIRSPIKSGALRLLGRPDLRRTHRLGHAEEDRHSLTAAPRRQRLLRVGEAAVDVLPVVHHPHVARG